MLLKKNSGKKIEGNFSVSSKGENSVMFRSVFCNNEYQKKKKKKKKKGAKFKKILGENILT